jgi:DNA-binding response OmpR family regulator
MSQTCPCCRQPLPPISDLTVDQAGILVRNGRFASLTRQEFSVFEDLRSSFPRLRSQEQLLTSLYWDRPEEPEVKIIDVFICKIRKKIDPLGLQIQTIWGRGYRFVPVATTGDGE